MYAFSHRLCPVSHRGAITKPTNIGAIPKPRLLYSPSNVPARRTPLSHRHSRASRCSAAEAKQPTTAKDPSLHQFQKLLETGSGSTEWRENVQIQGRKLTAHVEELRAAVAQKTNELGLLEQRLAETGAILREAKELQTTTEAQLSVRNNEVELLKSELNQLQQSQDKDGTASMERYRELEDALAHVESELRSQSESFHSKDATNPVDVGKLSEIVHEQDAVFQNLTASLQMAAEERQRAEDVVQEAKLKAEETQRVQTKLQQDQELLSKELSQLQILYAEKEMEWMNEMHSVKDDCDKLKEESAGLEVSLATKERKLKTLTGAFDALKSDYENSENRLAELNRECSELKAVNTSLDTQIKQQFLEPDQQSFTHLKSQLTRLQIRVPVLESEINEMAEQRKIAENQYASLEKDLRMAERKGAQLEQRATILQLSMEEKSNRLVAAQTEKRTMKSDADRLQREATALHQRLKQAEQEFEKFKQQLQKGQEEKRELQMRYQQEIISIAERQQEAQRVIVYHQEHKNENKDLKATIAGLTRELQERKNEIQQLMQTNANEIEKIRATLTAAESSLKEKDLEIASAEEERQKLESKISELRESSDAAEQGRSAEVAELKKLLQASKTETKTMEVDVLSLRDEMSKLQNELTQRQRIISVRDQEIVTLKDDARLANERVDALRGQITSMQTLNREMEVEMAETDGIVSKLNDRIRDLQGEYEEKQREVGALKKNIADLETKGKHSMEQFSSQIESLEEYSKQQEALVESFFEEKQVLEESVKQLKTQLEEQTAKEQESRLMYEKSKEECSAMKKTLNQTQLDLKMAKESAAAEIEEAAEILAKAEAMAQSVQGSLDEEPSMPNGAAAKDGELQERIELLENELQSERQAAISSAQVSEKLEAEVITLKQQVTALKELEQDVSHQATNQSDASAENELIAMSKRLSKSLAAEEAALSEIQRLREQIKSIESGRVHAQRDLHVMTPDERFNDLRRHANNLEADNEKLRKAAMKRNQILAQSRHFIEQYLDRSIPTTTLSDLQP